MFGFAAYAAILAARHAMSLAPWIVPGDQAGTGLTLLLAGAFQFTPLKYRCLEKCRSPLSFVIEHWQGRRQRWQAFRLGIDHGLFCVGCCWALMLLMFTVAVGSLGWMLALAAIMALEKNVRWGRRLGPVVGLALVAWGTFTLAF